MRVRSRLLLSLPLLAAAAAALAAPVDPALFQDLHWRSVGPYRGGRVLAVAGDPADPRRFYFGAVNGGVWRTEDAGRTWQPIFDRVDVGSIGAIAVAPSNPKVIYVGTGEADMRSDIAQGIGMFRSSDGGATWQAYKQESVPTSLTTASEWLDKLASAVESADGAPTPDDLRSFALLSAALDNLEKRWRAIARTTPAPK